MKSGKSNTETLPAQISGKSNSISLKKCNLADRIKTVSHWILEGNSMFDVLEAMDAASLTKPDQKKIMGGVLEYFTKSGDADPDVVRGWCLESLRELYRKMVAIGDFANAVKVVKDIFNLNNK